MTTARCCPGHVVPAQLPDRLARKSHEPERRRRQQVGVYADRLRSATVPLRRILQSATDTQRGRFACLVNDNNDYDEDSEDDCNVNNSGDDDYLNTEDETNVMMNNGIFLDYYYY